MEKTEDKVWVNTSIYKWLSNIYAKLVTLTKGGKFKS